MKLIIFAALAAAALAGCAEQMEYADHAECREYARPGSRDYAECRDMLQEQHWRERYRGRHRVIIAAP